MSNNIVDTVDSQELVLKLTDLIKASATFMENEINAENCLSFWAVAKEHNCANLLEVAKRYTCDHFMDVCKTQEFLALDNGRLGELLACDEVRVKSEDDILLSLIKWLQHEQCERAQFVGSLVSLVRVPHLSPAFVVEQKDFISVSIALIKEILQWLPTPIEKRPAMNANSIRERNWIRSETLLAVATGKPGIQIQQYSNQNDEWTTWAILKPEQNRVCFGVALIGSELVTAGGDDGMDDTRTNTVWSISLKTKAIKPLNPMGACRSSMPLVVLDDDIYAVGGYDGDKWLKSVERWNRGTEKWSNVAPMLEVREYPKAAVLNGSIYVIGAESKTMECYNPYTNTWALRASMLEKRNEPGFAVLDKYLYAVGGWGIKSVERYDPETNTWTMMCSLNGPRWKTGCIAMKDRFIAAGGYDKFGGNERTIVQEYDPIINVWTQKSSLKIGGECVLVITKDIP